MKERKKKERAITKAEKRRIEKMAETEAVLAAEGYRREDMIISIAYANIMAFVLGGPPSILFAVIFYLRFPGWHFEEMQYGGFLLSILIIIGIFIHEGIHGLIWGTYAKNGFKSIEFGFMKEYLTPYCTCADPLLKKQYIIGALMPTIILGLIPMIASVITGSVIMLWFGVVHFFGGGGDLTVIGKLLKARIKEGDDVIIMDHPSECGLILFRR